MALSGHAARTDVCPLLGVKRTLQVPLWLRLGLVHHPAAWSYFNDLQEFAKTAPQLCFTSNSIQVKH
jgi:hypothetical protein